MVKNVIDGDVDLRVALRLINSMYDDESLIKPVCSHLSEAIEKYMVQQLTEDITRADMIYKVALYLRQGIDEKPEGNYVIDWDFAKNK